MNTKSILNKTKTDAIIASSGEPFIKKIKTRNRYYIYGVNSNELIQVEPIIYDIIDEPAGIDIIQV